MYNGSTSASCLIMTCAACNSVQHIPSDASLSDCNSALDRQTECVTMPLFVQPLERAQEQMNIQLVVSPFVFRVRWYRPNKHCSLWNALTKHLRGGKVRSNCLLARRRATRTSILKSSAVENLPWIRWSRSFEVGRNQPLFRRQWIA